MRAASDGRWLRLPIRCGRVLAITRAHAWQQRVPSPNDFDAMARTLLTRRRVLRLKATAASHGGAWRLCVSRGAVRLNVTRYRRGAQLATRAELRIAVIADIHAGEPWMPAARVAPLSPNQCAEPGPDPPARRFHAAPSLPAAGSRQRNGPRPRRAQARRSASTPCSAITTGGMTWKAQWLGRGPTVGVARSRRVGIPVYENDARRLTKDGQSFWLAGLGDQWALH